MTSLVRMPPHPGEPPAGEAEIPLRYDDVSQDGRLRVEALPVVLEALMWNRILLRHKHWPELRADGILPILTRLVVVGGDGPVAVSPIRAVGHWQLARVEDEDGEVERLVLLTWCEAHGRRGRTHDPQPERAGEPIQLGRLFAEYTLTRPYVPRPQRAVRSLRLTGLPSVPELRYEVDAPAALAALPRGAEPIDPHPSTDPVPVVFGLDDTDSNQHVNSLVYLRTLRGAALRRLAFLGLPGPHPLRQIEIAYRRPCFAGDQLTLELRTFRAAEQLGVAAALGPPDGSARRSCHARLVFD